MKQLASMSRNVSHVIVDDKLVTFIEAVVSTVERELSWVGGKLQSVEVPSNTRWYMSISGAKDFAKELHAWIADAEAEAMRLTIDGNQ